MRLFQRIWVMLLIIAAGIYTFQALDAKDKKVGYKRLRLALLFIALAVLLSYIRV